MEVKESWRVLWKIPPAFNRYFFVVYLTVYCLFVSFGGCCEIPCSHIAVYVTFPLRQCSHVTHWLLWFIFRFPSQVKIY